MNIALHALATNSHLNASVLSAVLPCLPLPHYSSILEGTSHLFLAHWWFASSSQLDYAGDKSETNNTAGY
jgi:hypothetical protein